MKVGEISPLLRSSSKRVNLSPSGEASPGLGRVSSNQNSNSNFQKDKLGADFFDLGENKAINNKFQGILNLKESTKGLDENQQKFYENTMHKLADKLKNALSFKKDGESKMMGEGPNVDEEAGVGEVGDRIDDMKYASGFTTKTNEKELPNPNGLLD